MSQSPSFPTPASGHVAPDALLRRLDAAAAPDELAAIESHLAVCDTCRLSAERVERQSRDFGGLLARAYPAVPATWQPPERRPDRRASWWPMAAVLAALIAAGAVAPPVRAWVVERWHALTASGGAPGADRTDDDRGTPEVESRPQEGAGNVVVFQPGGAEFAIEVSELVTGRLTIAVTAGGAAAAEVLRGIPPEIVVLPNGLRVMADSTLNADLEIRLPATVRRIAVRSGGRLLGEYRTDTTQTGNAGQRWEVELGM